MMGQETKRNTMMVQKKSYCFDNRDAISAWMLGSNFETNCIYVTQHLREHQSPNSGHWR